MHALVVTWINYQNQCCEIVAYLLFVCFSQEIYRSLAKCVSNNSVLQNAGDMKYHLCELYESWNMSRSLHFALRDVFSVLT